VAHHLVTVEQRDHRAGDERAEDDLQPEPLGDGGEADEQDQRRADADLSRRVLQAQDVGADPSRALGAAHGEEDDQRQRGEGAEQEQRGADASLAREEEGQQDDRAEVGGRGGRHVSCPKVDEISPASLSTGSSPRARWRRG
jgi:hypothetical protein